MAISTPQKKRRNKLHLLDCVFDIFDFLVAQIVFFVQLSVNLVSRELLPLMDYFGTRHAKDGKKDQMPYHVCRGAVIDVPVLDESRWVYECEVAQAVETGASTTFFCRIRNVQMDGDLTCEDTFDIDLTRLDPVIYSGMYHSIGKLLGKIGDFS